MPIRKSMHFNYPQKLFVDMSLIKITISEEIRTKFSFQILRCVIPVALSNNTVWYVYICLTQLYLLVVY